ncbi:MAG: hypothetical protein H6739_27560 [Alphaproteobacteria bacterium]|nr:hypothetical protein [Alphaproteobacteria bacterium]
MKVVLAGLGRTGTQSMLAAFQLLGLRTLDQKDLIRDPDRLHEVMEMVRGERPFTPDILGDAEATVGWPLCWLYAEQLAAFPDAKCVLNVRDADAWFDSVSRAHAVLNTIRKIPFNKKIRALDGMVGVLERRMGGPMDRALWTRGYRAHNEAVKANVPADRLLVYELGAGWEPLCAFLDMPTPAADFPRGNSSKNEEFKETARRLLLG